MSKNYTVTDDAGRVHNIVADKRPTMAELRGRGFSGKNLKLSAEIPPPPPPELTEAEKEAARLNVMTRAEFMAEVLAQVDKRIAEAKNALVGN